MPAYYYHLSFELYPTCGSDWSVPIDQHRDSTAPTALRSEGQVLISSTFHRRRRSDGGSTRSIDRHHGRGSTSEITSTDSITLPLQNINQISLGRVISSLKCRDRPSPSSSRDWRFSFISMESIDMAPARRADSRARSRRKPSTPNDTMITTGMGAFAARGRFQALQPDRLDLGWGVVHLYRDGKETPALDDHERSTLSASERPRRAASFAREDENGSEAHQDDCSTLCVLAVPSYLTPFDFLGFAGERTIDDVTHVRMIRTEKTNRYMVLMKFRDHMKAKQWQTEHNGKLFTSIEVRA